MAADLREGWVDAELAEEFPELGLRLIEVESRPRRTPRTVEDRLRDLSNRYTGGKVIHMRQDPVPWAFRVFYRQVGIDPDTDRTPAEHVALERLRKGGFAATNLVDDALTIAVAETGVPVIAFDAERVGSALGLRLSQPGERLAGTGRERSLAVLFGEVSEDRGVTPDTERMVLCALRVKGVPHISVEEALWTAAETLETPA
jgi:DNA/RNA-binding domain of Phe-tRNA-synthetase-like protein